MPKCKLNQTQSEFIKIRIVCVYVDISQNIKSLLYLLVQKSHFLQMSQLWTKAKRTLPSLTTDVEFLTTVPCTGALHWGYNKMNNLFLSLAND